MLAQAMQPRVSVTTQHGAAENMAMSDSEMMIAIGSRLMMREYRIMLYSRRLSLVEDAATPGSQSQGSRRRLSYFT